MKLQNLKTLVELFIFPSGPLIIYLNIAGYGICEEKCWYIHTPFGRKFNLCGFSISQGTSYILQSFTFFFFSRSPAVWPFEIHL